VRPWLLSCSLLWFLRALVNIAVLRKKWRLEESILIVD